eukprot:349785-Chlamydomonas_euryale.AAC.16
MFLACCKCAEKWRPDGRGKHVQTTGRYVSVEEGWARSGMFQTVPYNHAREQSCTVRRRGLLT